MADDADRTDRILELALEGSLHRNRRPEGPKPRGRCLTCEEILAPPLRWCDATCRDEWEEIHERR